MHLQGLSTFSPGMGSQLEKWKAFEWREYTPEGSSQRFVVSPLVYSRKQNPGLITLGWPHVWKRHHPVSPSFTQLPSAGMLAHPQIHILICKVEENIELTIQSHTNSAVITTTVKVSKHQLIWASQFSDKLPKYVRFFKQNNRKQHKCYVLCGKCF